MHYPAGANTCEVQRFRTRINLLMILIFINTLAFPTFSQQPKLIPPVGHSGFINNIVLTKDNKYALSSSNDKTAKLWDTRTGKLIHTFFGCTERVVNVSLSDDETKVILTSGGENGFRIYDLQSGNLDFACQCQAFSDEPCGVVDVRKSLAITKALNRNMYYVWDIREQVKIDSIYKRTESLILFSSLSYDQKLGNVYLTADNKLFRYNLLSKKYEDSLVVNKYYTQNFVLSPGFRTAVIRDYNTLKIANLIEDRSELLDSVEIASLQTVKYMNEDSILYISHKKSLNIYSVKNRTYQTVVDGNFRSIQSISQDGRYCSIEADQFGKIYVVDLKTKGILRSEATYIAFLKNRDEVIESRNQKIYRSSLRSRNDLVHFQSHVNLIQSAEPLRNGNILTKDHYSVVSYNLKNNTRDFKIDLTRSYKYGLAGKAIIVAQNKTTANLYSLENGAILRSISIPDTVIYRATYIENRNMLYVGLKTAFKTFNISSEKWSNNYVLDTRHPNIYSEDGSLVLTINAFDVSIADSRTGFIKHLIPFPRRQKYIDAVISKDCKLALLKTNANQYHLYELASEKIKSVLDIDLEGINSFESRQIHPDTVNLVFEGENGYGRMNFLNDYSRRSTIHLSKFNSVSDTRHINFSPSGKYLTQIQSRQISVYSSSSRKILYRYSGTEIRRDFFSPDERYLFLNMGDGADLQMYDASNGKLIRALVDPLANKTTNLSEQHSFRFLTHHRFSELGPYLLLSYSDLSVSVWNYISGNIIAHCKISEPGLGRYGNLDGFRFEKQNSFLAFYLESKAYLLSLDGRNRIISFTQDNHPISSTFLDLSGKYLVSTYYDGCINKWDVNSGKFLHSTIFIDSIDHVVIDSLGYFDGTFNGIKHLYFQCGNEIIQLDQLKEIYWAPGLSNQVNYSSRRTVRSGNEILNQLCNFLPIVQHKSSNDSMYVFNIFRRSGGVGDVGIWLNGQQTTTLRPEELKIVNDIYHLEINKKSIQPLLSEDSVNVLEVRAYTNGNTYLSNSDSIWIHSQLKKHTEPPGLKGIYMIYIGIDKYVGSSLNTLTYPSVDAVSMERVLSNSARYMLSSDSSRFVKSYLLVSDSTLTSSNTYSPSRKNIKMIIDSVRNNVSSKDVVLIFMSGHGALNKDRRFHLLTSEAISDRIDGFESHVSISSDSLREWLSSIRTNKKILILDACYSGGTIDDISVANRSISEGQRSINDLNFRTGTYILSASLSNQSAREMSLYQHGALTYSLLKAIQDGTGLQKSNEINVAKWFENATNILEPLALQNGFSQTPRIYGNGDAASFPIGIVSKSTQKDISLAESGIVINRIVCLDVQGNNDAKRIHDDILNQLNNFIYKQKSRFIRFNAGGDDSTSFTIYCGYRSKKKRLQLTLSASRGDDLIKVKLNSSDGTVPELNQFFEDMCSKLRR